MRYTRGDMIESAAGQTAPPDRDTIPAGDRGLLVSACDPSQRTFPSVICPGCRKPMTPTITEAGPHNFNLVTYRCDTCANETQRIVKPDRK